MEKSLVRKPSVNYAPIANYKQFMPATSQTIVQSHAESEIQKLIREEEFEDPDFKGDDISLFGRDWEALNE